MAKKKAKSKGSPGGLDLDKKQQLEKELHETLFQSGGCRTRIPDLEDEGRDPGASSSFPRGQGNSQGGSATGMDGTGSNSADLRVSSGGSGSFSSSSPSNPTINPGKGKQEDPKKGKDVNCEQGEGGRTGSTMFRPGQVRSFAQVARGSRRASIAERLHHVPNINGDCIQYTCKDIAAPGEAWKATILGAVMGPPIPNRELSNFIRNSWKVKPPTLFLKNTGILVFKFDSEDDLRWVIEHGLWSIGSSPLLLKQWVSGAAMDWSFFKSVSVWVRIPDLPPIFCSNPMLSMIGSGIGLPLCIDEYTSNQEMLSYARLLVEINAEQARRKSLMLRNEKGVECPLKVIFEWLTWNRSICKCFGHTEATCLVPPLSFEPVTAVGGSPLGEEKFMCPSQENNAARNDKNAENKCGNSDNSVNSSGISGGIEQAPGKADAACNDRQPRDGHTDSSEGDNSGAAVGCLCTEHCVCDAIHPDGAAPTRSTCIQTEKEEDSIGQCNEMGSGGANVLTGSNPKANAVLDGSTMSGIRAAEQNEVLDAGGASNHAKSLACARMVASSWAAESGIYANRDGELEINECKTPDGLMRWKTRGGVQRGAYLLRGTKSRISGDLKLSLTMDELFTVMSGIKNPPRGEDDTVHFNEESDIDECGDSTTDDEDYQPG